MTCKMPPNFGRRHPVIVTAVEQSSEPYLFDYDAPFVASVVPVRDVLQETGRGARFDAKGGTDVIVTGRNFGDLEERHGKVMLSGVECNNVLFIRDNEVRCTLPGNQAVGNGSLVVVTWNPTLVNGSDERHWQASVPFNVVLQCPEGYYGRVNEVRRNIFSLVHVQLCCPPPSPLCHV